MIKFVPNVNDDDEESHYLQIGNAFSFLYSSLCLSLSTVRAKDFCCNKICRCLWNQKCLSEQHVSIMPGKLKAHKYFRQGKKFQGSLKIYGATSICTGSKF